MNRGQTGASRMIEADRGALRAAGVARVIVALVVALAAGFGLVGGGWWDRSMNNPLLAVALMWLPWAVLLLVAGSKRPGGTRHLRLAVYGGPFGDVVIVFAAQCLVPWAWGVLLLVDALTVSFAASLWRARDAWLLLGFCVGLTMLAQAIVPAEHRLAVPLLVAFALALAGLVVVVGRIARDHRLAAVSSHRFQQKAETILARVAEAIVVTDGFGIVQETNPAGERLMGREDESVVGVPCGRALGLRDGERTLDCWSGCPLLAAGSTADARAGHEVWRMLPDGRRQPLLASAFAVVDEHGGTEVVHSLRDITRLKEADEAKTLFLATASHELKTPVTVIAGFAEAILRYPAMPSDRRAEAVEAIRRRALELSSIVDRLLLSSKIEGGRVNVDLHAVDVRAIVIEQADTFRDSTGRHVVVQLSHEALVAQADPLALRTVVDHLLDNAVKYSDGGPVVLGARVNGDTVVISVSDIGIGMDEFQARRCFDKFWQAESTDVRRFGGTGIGLYMVSSLVEAMAGAISVETAVGQGSTFTVAIPVVVDQPISDELESIVEQSPIKDFMRQIGVLSRGTA
ncbi:MAG TPA: PAS domain-containing sensor histidine kinase [Acidimicrobiales bacterium]|nr:PAS domain-containing sensor histidine kinase [Acidimicrobiales bacterium]